MFELFFLGFIVYIVLGMSWQILKTVLSFGFFIFIFGIVLLILGATN
jgi:hypothetical protein